MTSMGKPNHDAIGRPASGARIELKGVSKSFGDVVALHPVDLTIEPGEFITLLGPSGCGKSTTLNIIAGLEQPTAGAVYFNGQDITPFPPQKRNIAMVFQSYALYPHMTVEENISFPLRRRALQIPREAVASRTSAMSRTLGLTELMKRLPAELSGGQRQRVAVGRALVREPVAFLMDEPLSNLDNQLRVEMRSELHELHRRYTITTVYVTHDQAEAMVLSDRVVVIKDGAIQQVGTPEEIYRHPGNHFVASFMGDRGMNILDTSGLEPGGGPIVGEKSIPGRATTALSGPPKTIGVWPEDLTLSPAGKDALFEGEVRSIEYLGSEVMFEIAVAGDKRLWARGTPGQRFSVGDRLGIGFAKASSLSMFDTDGVSLGSWQVQ